MDFQRHRHIGRTLVKPKPALLVNSAPASTQQGFRGDGTHSAGAQEFYDGYEQVNRQEKQIAHGLHVITFANLRKTAPPRLFEVNLPIRQAQVTLVPFNSHFLAENNPGQVLP